MTHSTRLARLHAVTIFACCSLLASATISPGLAQEQPKTSVQDPDKRKVKFDFLGDALPPHALLRFGTNRFNPSSITSLALAPDNKSVVTSAGGRIIGWGALTGKELWNRQVRSPRSPQRSSASYGTQTMVTSPSGSLVACGHFGKIVFLDFHAGKTTRTINSSVKENFKSIDVSPDGKWFAGGNENQLVVFDESGNTKFSIENDVPNRKEQLFNSEDLLMFGGEYSHARFTPDGRQLVLVHSQNPRALNVVDFESGKIVRKILTQGNVVRFDFSKDGSQVVTTERDIAARLYNLDSGNQVWEQVFSKRGQKERYTTDVRFSPDGKSIAVGTAIGNENQSIRILNPKNGEVTGELARHWNPWCVRFTSDSKQLYSSGWDRVVRRWDLAKQKQIIVEGLERAGGFSTVSPDGKMIAYSSENGKLFVVDIKTGKRLCKLSPKENWIYQIAFSHDSKVLAAGLTSSDSIHLRTWKIDEFADGDGELDESAKHWTWPNDRDVHSRIQALSFSGDDKLLAVCMFRQSACKIFSLDPDNPTEPIDLEHRSVHGLCLSWDHRRMVTAGWDKEIRLWDTKTGEQIKSVTNDTPGGDPRMYGVLYSPDGRSIATMEMSGRVKIWTPNLEEPLEIKTVDSHFGSFEYSRNGLWISVGGYDGDVAVYDTQTGHCVWRLGKHTGSIYNVSFGALDKTLLSSGSDGVCYLWDLNANAADTGDLQVTKDAANGFAQQLITGEAKEAFKAHQAFAAMKISNQAELGIPAIDAATTSVFESWKDADEEQNAKLNIGVRRTAMLLAEMKSPAADSLLDKLQKSSPNLAAKKEIFIARRHRKRFLKRLGLELQTQSMRDSSQ